MFILTNFVALHESKTLNLAKTSKKSYNLDGNGSRSDACTGKFAMIRHFFVNLL